MIKVPRDAPLEILGPLGVRGADRRAVRAQRPAPEPGSTLAVFGAGGVGLSALIAAVHLTGATTAVVDVNPARLELATRLGAAHVVNAREQDPVEALMEFSGGRGIDRTLEATGVPPSSARRSTCSPRWACAASSARPRRTPRSR